ncbi:MAG TPA: VanZ family protein [Gemmatimonadaceae bacterium]|nr:VanZ family protein [Gemmatimonadaceae bacterium]
MRRAHLALGVILAVGLASKPLVAQAVKQSSHPDGWFGLDKVKHFFMSAFINTVSYSALQWAGVNHSTARTAAIGITMAAGLGRELHDMRVPGNIFSVRDLTWDAIGTAAGAAITAHTIR